MGHSAYCVLAIDVGHAMCKEIGQWLKQAAPSKAEDKVMILLMGFVKIDWQVGCEL